MIIPKSGEFIKHERFLDVALRIDKTYVIEDKYFIFKGRWWNQAFVESFDLGMQIKLKIPQKKIGQYLICENSLTPCIRYEKWRRLA